MKTEPRYQLDLDQLFEDCGVPEDEKDNLHRQLVMLVQDFTTENYILEEKQDD